MDFEELSAQLLNTPEMQQLKQQRHHRNVNRYDHSLHVARTSYRLASKLHLDADACARAALLHDLFVRRNPGDFPRRHLHTPRVILYPEDAERNAEALVQLGEMEKNIILSHMWPVTRHWPRSREAWLVICVDKAVAVGDYFRRKKPACTQIRVPDQQK